MDVTKHKMPPGIIALRSLFFVYKTLCLFRTIPCNVNFSRFIAGRQSLDKIHVACDAGQVEVESALD